jgi:enoyl-[acyl-carrier protein] reductase I
MTLTTVKAKLLEGRKGLIVGIANDRAIAWGCARAFRALGAELAITYLNEKARPHVEPLAREVEAPIFLPMDMMAECQLEAVFEHIAHAWGGPEFLIHSIAYSTKDALGGRVADVPRQGFQVTMDVSVWSFIRMAQLAEPLMKNGGTLFTMTYYGSQMVVENYNIMGVAKAALESAVRYLAAELGRRASESTRSPPAPSLPAPPRASRNSTRCSRRPRSRRPPAHSSTSTTSARPAPSSPTTRQSSSPARSSSSTADTTSSTEWLPQRRSRRASGPAAGFPPQGRFMQAGRSRGPSQERRPERQAARR